MEKKEERRKRRVFYGKLSVLTNEATLWASLLLVIFARYEMCCFSCRFEPMLSLIGTDVCDISLGYSGLLNTVYVLYF